MFQLPNGNLKIIEQATTSVAEAPAPQTPQDVRENNSLGLLNSPSKENGFEKCKNYMSADLDNIYQFVLNPDVDSQPATLSFNSY